MAKKTSGVKGWYRRWKESPLSGITHWAIFIAIALIAANNIVMSIAFESDVAFAFNDRAEKIENYLEE